MRYSIVPNGDDQPILVVKLDVLGDYLLFRNFLREASATIWAGREIVLVGNQANRAVAEYLDSDIISEFIWVDARGRFLTRLSARWAGLRAVRKQAYVMVLHPTAKRFYFTEALVKVAAAPAKIGWAYQAYLGGRHFGQASDGLYTRLLSSSTVGHFELEAQRSFWQQALGQDFSQVGHRLPRHLTLEQATLARQGLAQPYALICPGAGFAHKTWPAERFASVARYLHQNYQIQVVIAGGPAEAEAAKIIQALVPEALSLVGRTTQVELLHLCAGSRLIICNDSGPMHIGAGYGVETFAVCNSHHLGWWHPYPSSIASRVHTIYPARVQADMERYLTQSNTFSTGEVVPIEEISALEVINVISHILPVSEQL